MFKKKGIIAVVGIAFVWAIAGCTTVEKDTPDVVTTPGTNTIVHDQPSSPNVVVTPPTSSHTETHTNTTTTPPTTGTATSTSTTTTGGN